MLPWNAAQKLYGNGFQISAWIVFDHDSVRTWAHFPYNRSLVKESTGPRRMTLTKNQRYRDLIFFFMSSEHAVQPQSSCPDFRRHSAHVTSLLKCEPWCFHCNHSHHVCCQYYHVRSHYLSLICSQSWTISKHCTLIDAWIEPIL